MVKLVGVFTEEPSQQQLTPLAEQHAEPPAPVLPKEVQPASPQSLVWWLPWINVAKAIGVWVVSLLLLVFVPAIVTLPYLIYRIATTGAPSVEALVLDKTSIFLQVIGILPTHLLTFVVTWMFISNRGRRPFWKPIGFEWPANIRPVIGGLLSVLVAVILLLVAWLVTKFWGGNKTALDLLIESSMATRFVTAFVAVATAPLVEELIYRGVVYPAIEKAAGVAVAVVAVSLLFAGVHVFQYMNNIAVIVVITLLSFTLTIARAVTGKLMPSFVIHLVFNGIQSIILVLAPFIDKGTG